MTYTRFILGSTCCLLLSGLTACQWLIPEDQSVPRYNSVSGQRHRPVNNSVAPSNIPTPANTGAQNMSVPAPVAPVTMNDVPSSAPAPMKAIPAEQPKVTQLAPLPVPPVSPDVQAKANAQIAKDPALMAASGRQVPVENREFTVAANTGAGLMNVPSRPVNVGPNSPTERLNEARKDLEQSRTDAANAKAQLANDVASEPSAFPEKLAPLPAPNAAPAPVASVPPQARNEPNNPSYIAAVDLTPPPPLPQKPAMQAPVALAFSGTPEPVKPLSAPSNSATPAPVLTSTPVAIVPATTTLAAAPISAHSFNPMAPVPPAPPVLRPIQLTPPSATASVPVTVAARAETPAPVSSLPPSSSDFNPLAGAQMASSTTGATYLPPSRYANRY